MLDHPFHWIITAIIFPIPLIHLWLHALLPWWKKRPILFYFFCALAFAGATLLLKKLAIFSPRLFFPSNGMVRIGVALIAVGALSALSSVLTLGLKRFFLWAVFYPASVSQIRIARGPFTLVPHPAYMGYVLVAFGNFISSGALYLGAAFVYLLSITPLVIYLEERELKGRTGT